MTVRRLQIALLCSMILVACSRGGTQIALPALDRSGKIQLLCADIEQRNSFDIDLRSVLPLDACELQPSELASGFTPNGLGAVTQVQSGEVAALNFTNRIVFDTNTAVPGFTAFRVGEQPTGIRISEFNPEVTYIASFSAKTVQAYPTEILLTADQDDDLPTQDRTILDAGPTDLELYERVGPSTIERDSEGLITNIVPGEVEFRWLFAPLPDQGVVAQVRANADGTLDEATLLPLETATCDTVAPVPPPASTSADYHRICPDTGAFIRDIKTIETTTPCTDGPAEGPRPIAVHVDDGGTPDDFTDDVLLVADTNQPVVHRFSLSENGAEPLDVLVALTPTSEVVTTPFVPASFDNQAATQRYVYAISAFDGSILVFDYSPDSDSFGAVLPVLAGVDPRANEENVESRNRIRSAFSNARAIEVITPEYELTTDPSGNLVVPPSSLCDPLESNALALGQNASNMRGVFLAVSIANGSMFFLDIYDLNAPCRGAGCNNVTEPDALASIRRHRRRVGLTPTSFIEVQGSPALVFNASQGTINPDTGAASNSDGPGLEFVACPESMFSIFGVAPTNETDGLVCTSSQIWNNFSQRWDALWEGPIPNSNGGLGLFADESFSGEPGLWFQAGDVPFCEIGVIGPSELPGADPSTGLTNSDYVGDRLLIVGIPPASRRDDPACLEFEDVPDEIEDLPIWFPIVRAFNDQLEIGPSPNPGRYTLAEVAFCYPEFTEYQIHTQDAYTVTGTLNGFVNRVVPDPMTNECVLDENRPIEAPGGVLDVDTVLSGRAFPGVQYVNPFVSFEIQPFSGEVPITDSTFAVLTFSLFNGYGFLVIDTSAGLSSLPSSMSFSPNFDQLFFVDLEVGVRRIIFDPLSTQQTFQ